MQHSCERGTGILAVDSRKKKRKNIAVVVVVVVVVVVTMMVATMIISCVYSSWFWAFQVFTFNLIYDLLFQGFSGYIFLYD